jgi:hypothetical protein
MYYRSQKVIDTNFFRNGAKYIARSMSGPTVDVEEKFISVVTRCMNRLHDLKVTLPRNLADNQSYGKAEFVILDYNSTDGMGDWVRQNMMEHIESGRLVYYRTSEPQYFHPNHSQNVTFRLAKGDLVANVDSDNFTQKDYLRRLNQCASVDEGRLFIAPSNFMLPRSDKLYLKGRFCMYKKDIETLRGFDEDLDIGFGSDDLSFALRALLAGFRLVRYESYFSDVRLPTKDSERVALCRNKNYDWVLERNSFITFNKLSRGVVSVNRGRHWGKAVLTRNFTEEVRT